MNREVSNVNRATRAAQLHKLRHSAGLTIVEILIALLVISIGLLGVAGLHAYSLRSNHDALVRSHASALAADILDRMRANRTAVYPSAGTSEYVVNFGDDPAVEEDSSVAIRDVAAWKDALESQLPAGQGRIAIDVDTRIVTVEIQWGERDTEDPVSFVTETEI